MTANCAICNRPLEPGETIVAHRDQGRYTGQLEHVVCPPPPAPEPDWTVWCAPRVRPPFPWFSYAFSGALILGVLMVVAYILARAS